MIIAWFLCNNCCWIWLAGGVHFREELKLCFQFLQLSLPLAPTSLFWPCSGVYDWFSCWFKGCPQTLQSNLQVVQMLRFQFLPRLSLLLAPVTLIPSWSESHTEQQSREKALFCVCTIYVHQRHTSANVLPIHKSLFYRTLGTDKINRQRSQGLAILPGTE